MRIISSTIMIAVAFISFSAFGAESQKQAAKSEPSVSELGNSGKKKRNFYQVLEDLLSDFEYDLKNGEVRGLKNLSVRNIGLSENIPDSFKNHVELLVTERVLKNTNARIVQCLECKARKAKLSGDNMVVTSPDTNPAELSRIAKRNGILNFMDISFAYRPSAMILSFHITEPDTNSVIWSRSYNSETSRAAAFRRGVDYSQLDEARKAKDYTPTIQFRALVYYLFERNISEYTGTLGLGFRMVERYDNRNKEVGFELNYLLDSTSIAGGTTTTNNLYSGFNLTLLFIHAWNFIGVEENYNRVRGSIFVGVGGTYASGFLGGLLRTGYEWRMAKHWAVNLNIGYRPPATAFIDSTGTSVTGIEAGLGISALF